MSYYGQNKAFPEDKLASALLPQPHGYFIEVGAHDGITLSNTLHFERRGWDGICIEAHPKVYQSLLRNRKCITVYGAAGAETDEDNGVTFLAEPHGTMSGIRPKVVQAEAEARAAGRVWGGFTEVRVPLYSLDSILIMHPMPRIDLVSIDVETTELDVLRGFNLQRWQPRLVIVEENDTGAIYQYMSQLGYIRAVSIGAENSFYVRSQADASILQEALNGA